MPHFSKIRALNILHFSKMWAFNMLRAPKSTKNGHGSMAAISRGHYCLHFDRSKNLGAGKSVARKFNVCHKLSNVLFTLQVL